MKVLTLVITSMNQSNFKVTFQRKKKINLTKMNTSRRKMLLRNEFQEKLKKDPEEFNQ